MRQNIPFPSKKHSNDMENHWNLPGTRKIGNCPIDQFNGLLGLVILASQLVVMA